MLSRILIHLILKRNRGGGIQSTTSAHLMGAHAFVPQLSCDRRISPVLPPSNSCSLRSADCVKVIVCLPLSLRETVPGTSVSDDIRPQVSLTHYRTQTRTYRHFKDEGPERDNWSFKLLTKGCSPLEGRVACKHPRSNQQQAVHDE